MQNNPPQLFILPPPAKRNKTSVQPVSSHLLAGSPPEYRLSFRLSSGASRIANHPVRLTVVHDRWIRFPARSGERCWTLVGEGEKKKKEKKGEKRATKRNEIAGHYPGGIGGRNRDRVITCEQRGLRTRAARWQLRGKHSVTFVQERGEGGKGRFEREFSFFNASLSRKRLIRWKEGVILWRIKKSKCIFSLISFFSFFCN